ncbi:nucleotidyltransferase domain-containing protein [Cyanobacteria bacterium FACHB-471]|nr:nucleotidyltransferase domain-containing protein [Cyanobacteria bacterium FACHB-471]
MPLGKQPTHVKYNLKLLLSELVDEQVSIAELWMFGSRAYGTQSLRSDCDILVRVKQGEYVKASALRDFALTQCRALDFFIAEGGRAISCMNDSYVWADAFEELVEKLDALLLWSAQDGFTEPPVSWVFEVGGTVNFAATVLPDGSVGELSWQYMIKRAEDAGLPVCPFIGDTVDKATAMLTEIAKRMILKPTDLGQRGAAKDSWTVNLKSEYDCQNLFYTVVKPWLPSIAREEVTVIYDEQRKSADFAFFDNQLIVEMKFIDSNGKKAEVVKTLDGLARFYKRNGNIRVLLFLIFVKEGVDVDAYRWSRDYSFYSTLPRVITHVIMVP